MNAISICIFVVKGEGQKIPVCLIFLASNSCWYNNVSKAYKICLLDVIKSLMFHPCLVFLQQLLQYQENLCKRNKNKEMKLIASNSDQWPGRYKHFSTERMFLESWHKSKCKHKCLKIIVHSISCCLEVVLHI